MKTMKIIPRKSLQGRLRVPGDKSISHRAAMIAALARGRSLLSNFSTSADCASTLDCLRALGVSVERDGTTVVIEGRGGDLSAPSSALDCGNSGTTMRLLAGILAGQTFSATLTGDESLSRRPMRRIIEPLELMGAKLSSQEGHAPLTVNGQRPLRAIDYEPPVASAQVKSCVLLAGLQAAGCTRIRERVHTRDHTERMLRWFGVPVEEREEGGVRLIALHGPKRFSARDISIPGDISSATFFLAAATLLPGSELVIEEVGLNRTRASVIGFLQKLGADIQIERARVECNEEIGDLRVRGVERLKPTANGANIISGALAAELIDELPALAVVGTRVAGGLEIRDAAELRVKESDRIRTTVENLRAMGAEVEERPDGLRVAGPARLRAAHLESYGDHRIAMAFAVAALTADDASELSGAESVAVSFPEFFDLLEAVSE
ncbi:MAG: 3-phosphoshikimate 1-carboxyvinyltransferase [Pyrinomonas methylaliphatogenes]|jgi:3-phosphoshikimate 1-carboxyvinyltransferase|nr:3-phosphoshikimate 1-carboxyvinyltransferase [Pyrinomonas methylaliphatogenes]